MVSYHTAEPVQVSNLEEQGEDILDENIGVGQLVGYHQTYKRE